MAVLGAEIAPEIDFEVGMGTEGRVAALGGNGLIAVASPAQATLAQTGAGGDDGDIALFILRARIEPAEVVRR